MPYKNYIYEYYAKISSGEIIVGKWIKKIFEIIINGLQTQEYFFNAKAANKAIKFIETFCHHSNGNPVDCFTVSEVNGERALHELLDAAILPHEFTCASDITTTNSTSIDGAVSVRNAMGGTEGSLLDVWCGEYHYDNYRVAAASGSESNARVQCTFYSTYRQQQKQQYQHKRQQWIKADAETRISVVF